jgi:hypothetical protein
MFDLTIKSNRSGNPPGKLADVEVHFTQVDIICPDCSGRGGTPSRIGPATVRVDECDRCKGAGQFGSPFAGLRLIGFEVWERRGERIVTFPSRQVEGEGSVALLRPIEDVAAEAELRECILDGWAQVERRERGAQ